MAIARAHIEQIVRPTWFPRIQRSRMIGILLGARWSYTIEPAGGGCRVTESWEDKRGAVLNFVGPLATGVKDRASHNEAGMRATLDRLKAVAEAGAR